VNSGLAHKLRSARSKIIGKSGFISRLLKDESLTKKAYLNAISAVINYGTTLVVGFVITPLLVAGLGDYFYGAWRVLERMILYVSPASGRPTQALKWVLANEQTTATDEQKRRYVGSTLTVWALFLPLIAVLGVILVWFAPGWLHTPAEYVWIVRVTIGLLVVDLIATTLVEVVRSALEGENLGYKRMGLSAALLLIGGALVWLALYLDSGMVGVAIATLVGGLVAGVVNLRIVRTYVSWFGAAKPLPGMVRRFLGLSWWFMAWNLVNLLISSSDIVVLGTLDSVEAVTSYSLTKYAPETVIAVISFGVLSAMPGLGGIIGAGNLQRASRTRSEIMSITWLVTTVLGSTILLWNPAFLRLWVGPEYYTGPIPALLITVVVTQFVLIRNDAYIIDLTLNLRHKVLVGALAAALALALAGVLVYYFDAGVTGLCIGFIAGRSILSIVYPLMIGRLLNITPFSQLRGILRPGLVTAFLFVATMKLGDMLSTSPWATGIGWIGLALSVGVTAVLMVLLVFYAGLSAAQQKIMIQRARLLVRSWSGR
jgi:O-antigen/teichoic acid export membrane protein